MYQFEQQYVVLYEKMLWSREGLSQSEQFAPVRAPLHSSALPQTIHLILHLAMR